MLTSTQMAPRAWLQGRPWHMAPELTLESLLDGTRRNLVFLLPVLFFLGFWIGSADAGRDHEHLGHCYEDEVILWDGDAHTRCIPLDDLMQYMKGR